MEGNEIPCLQLDPRGGEKRAKNYCRIDAWLSGILAFLFVVGCIAPSFSSVEYDGKLRFVLAVFFFLFVIHLWRAIWLHKALKKELKIVDDPSAYELERIALLSWLGMLILTGYQWLTKYSLEKTINEVFSSWLITLLLLSPIVILVGASWEKLYIESPNGKIYWPRCRKASNK